MNEYLYQHQPKVFVSILAAVHKEIFLEFERTSHVPRLLLNTAVSRLGIYVECLFFYRHFHFDVSFNLC